ncbi:MAG: class I SAM-dependent methyltransferase [Microgenomates group bacterium]
MKNSLLKILRCPQTKAMLRYVDGGIETIDGRYKYAIIDGIIIMNRKLGSDKETVKSFYDEIGWKKNIDNNFVDAEKYEDLRPVSANYVHKCHLRVNKYLTKGGEYLLDAGSGPVQYDEYLTYSKNFKYRICVDISFLALQEAKKKLGKKGIYILADLTNLPFEDNSVEGAVSMHVIYHIPQAQQKKAMEEINRVIKPKTKAVIIYTWPVMFSLVNEIGTLLRWLRVLKKSKINQEFYFNPLARDTFLEENKNLNIKIFVWRSVSVFFMRRYIHDNLGGKYLLNLLYELENRWPRFFGLYGRYPLVLIEKL